MYDDDIFNMLNSYSNTTTQDSETEETNQYQNQVSQQSQQTYGQNYLDDYSSSQNYQTEQNYQSQQTYGPNNFVKEDEARQSNIRTMEVPIVKKMEQPVSLLKSKQKLYLSNRLKLAVAVFAIIFMAFAFISVWNILKINSLNNSFLSKQSEITEMSQSINELSNTYNGLVEVSMSPDNVAGYTQKVDGENTFVVSFDDFYEEPEVKKITSNWFNDVCEFFSRLFA